MRSQTTQLSRHSVDTIPVALARMGFTERWITILSVFGLLAGVLFAQSCSTDAKAGPNGGDLVTLSDGKTSAEVVANSETGEAMVHTWNQDLKSALPIEAKALTLGADTNSVQLDPHPMPSDPPGLCSRFYGRADWLRGGSVHHGWIGRGGGESGGQHFEMNHGWKAGGAHGGMWSEMGGHGAGMEQGGHHGGDQAGHGGMRH